MPINTLEYAKIYQKNLDLQVVQKATSGWMEENAGQVIYNGGDEIKIPEIAVQGLADYDRDEGFNRGAVTYKYQTHKLTQDRGRTFHLDSQDVDETNFGATAANVLSEFQRTKVIPEIDAYRYSFLAAKATEKGNAEPYKLNESDILKNIYSHIFKLAEKGIDDITQLVITISYQAYEVLVNNEKIQKKIDVGQFSQGGINLQIKMLDGIPLIPVSSSRMKDSIVIFDGVTPGQEAGGFKPADGAKDVHWIITPRNAPIGISKTDKVRIFEPDTNQQADAWKIDYRKYHDMIIPENKAELIQVAVSA